MNSGQGNAHAGSRTPAITPRASPETVSVLRKDHQVRPAGVNHREADREHHSS